MGILFLFCPPILTFLLIMGPRLIFSLGCEKLLKSFGFKVDTLDILIFSIIGFLLQVLLVIWIYNLTRGWMN